MSFVHSTAYNSIFQFIFRKLMASTACFVIVSKNDTPIYEAELGSAFKDQRRLGAIILPTQDEVVALAKKLSILNGDAAELSKEKILNLLYDELRRWTIDCSFQIGPVLIVDEPFTVEVVFLVHDNESHDLSSELTRRWILGKKEESLVLGSERERVSEKKKKGEGFIDDHHLGAITKIVLQEQLS
ncbi:uncharacterized protein LOC109845347 isoform X2 [Asparagus officinalis]|uniref:uncharacterized protein LOC109845347 isoform X2 n=2 Tax=Asparagus officinalis TaxID=4686 RepID=UPI00098DEE09|nr:uncharacterized protein LOC109845347 isoform X2 [Asparagus officinalis]